MRPESRMAFSTVLGTPCVSFTTQESVGLGRCQIPDAYLKAVFGSNMYLSKHKRESLVGTKKEFLPIVNHKYKQKIAEIRKSIECAVTKYEEDQIKLQGFKEMKKYLEENAMSRATNKAVIKDMIARNECQLNDAARVYYFETKIKNQRSVKHKDINDINKVADRINPKNTIDKALGKDEDIVVQNNGQELKETSKARKDLHCPKRPATFVARHYTSSSKRQHEEKKHGNEKFYQRM